MSRCDARAVPHVIHGRHHRKGPEPLWRPEAFTEGCHKYIGPAPDVPRGNCYILVIGDYFTNGKRHFLFKGHGSRVFVIFVNEFICQFGVPDSLHTDQRKNFEAKVIKEICTLLDIKKMRTIAYHPQSDGLVERFNRTLLVSMMVKEDEQGSDLLLPTLLLA